LNLLWQDFYGASRCIKKRRRRLGEPTASKERPNTVLLYSLAGKLYNASIIGNGLYKIHHCGALL
jgi:hypothetical protein